MTTIRFVTSVALRDVIDRLGPAFERESGHRLELEVMLNPEVPGFIASGAEWSIAASNPWHLAEVRAAGRCGDVHGLGRTPLALAALRDGPFAGSGDDVAMMLRAARSIAVTGAGTSGATFARLLDRLGLAGELRGRVRPMGGGEPMAALLGGEVDLAALPLTNVAPIRRARAVATCAWDMDVHVDLAFCLHPGAGAAARALARWLADPAQDEALAALGLFRNVSGA